jgi:hypothetical protein
MDSEAAKCLMPAAPAAKNFGADPAAPAVTNGSGIYGEPEQRQHDSDQLRADPSERHSDAGR